MWYKLRGHITLRKQILIGFMLVMFIVLTTVGIIVFDRVSALLRNNAEKHIQQTAVQVTGKLDALLQQIDMLTLQVATNATVQQMLERRILGEDVSFSARQSLQREVRHYEAYTTGVRSLELYTTEYESLMPVTDLEMNNRIPIERINDINAVRGNLVWLGLDALDSDLVVAVRQVRLMDKSFMNGGYVVAKIDKSYFALGEYTLDATDETQGMMGLFDETGRTIFSNMNMPIDTQMLLSHEGETFMIGDESYIAVNHPSKRTGWTFVMLTPVDYTTEGISVLRSALIISGIIGAVLFLLFNFMLSTMITRPILNLIKAMRNSRFGHLKHNRIKSVTMEIHELNNTYNEMVDSLNELIEVVYEKEILQSRTELKALQAQINPHFLFNTLDAFYWALDEKGEEELAQIIVAMSGLFRYVIHQSDEEEWVTVGDELDHAERYLTIMKMRMQERLSWRLEADERLRSVPLPKLLIQPLIENAIQHGVEQRIGSGTIIVQATPSIREGYIRITVSDDGPGMNEEQLAAVYRAKKASQHSAQKGKGVGLMNVNRRLKLYYSTAGTQGIEIQSELGQGTTIMIEVPINKEGETS